MVELELPTKSIYGVGEWKKEQMLPEPSRKTLRRRKIPYNSLAFAALTLLSQTLSGDIDAKDPAKEALRLINDSHSSGLYDDGFSEDPLTPNIRKNVVEKSGTAWCEELRDIWKISGVYIYFWGYVARCDNFYSTSMLSWAPRPEYFPSQSVFELVYFGHLLGLPPHYGTALLYNECNLSPEFQCGETPSEAANFLFETILPAIREWAPGFEMVVGGATMDPCGIAWMSEFAEQIKDRNGGEYPPEIIGWHWHSWPDLQGQDYRNGYTLCEQNVGLSTWREQLDAVAQWRLEHGFNNGESMKFWLSEFGWHGDYYSETTRRAFLEDILNYFNSDGKWWDRVFYFAFWDETNPTRNLAVCDHPNCPPTPWGEVYKNWVPSPSEADLTIKTYLPKITK